MTDETAHCAGCRGYTRDFKAACPGTGLEAVLMAYARHPDGHDRPATLVTDFLATLKARSENPGLLWRELVGGRPGGAYLQDWYCEPPSSGAGFRVQPGRDEWATEDDMPVRRIYAIEVIDAAAEATARRTAGPGGVRPADGAGAGSAAGAAPEAPPPPASGAGGAGEGRPA